MSISGPSSHDITMEAPEVPPSGMAVSNDTSSFSQVVFPDISDYFPPEQDVTVKYVLSEVLQPSSRDWLGLFKVGWTTAREYVTFEWAPKPSGSNRTVTVKFQAYYLPKSNEEFYQFCYVTKQGQVRGASTPFQFRKPNECDLIEVEDETGMILLKTKSAILEEQLTKLTTKKETLEKEVAELKEANSKLEESLESSTSAASSLQKELKKKENECQGLAERITALAGKLDKIKASLKSDEEKLSRQKSQIKEANETISRLEKEKSTLNQKLTSQEKENKQQVSALNEQLDSKSTKVSELEVVVQDLTESLEEKKIKETAQRSELTKDRDSEKAKATRYKEEMDLYRKQLAQSEENRLGMSQEMKSAKEKIQRLEADIQAKVSKISAFEEKTKLIKNELKQSEKQLVVEKGALENQLSNLEDKLNACEASKRLISQELTEARDRRDQLMSELYQVKKSKDQLQRDLDASRRQLSELEKHYQETKDQATRREHKIAEKDGKIATEKLLAREKEKEMLKQIEILKTQLESADHALAQSSSTEDSDKSENGTQTATDEKKISPEQHEFIVSDLKMQIEDLRTRLSMGAAAYTEKYMECHKLERKMKKIHHQKSAPKPTQGKKKDEEDSTTADSQDDTRKKAKKLAAKPKSPPPQEEEQTSGGNFMSKLEQIFMAIADPDIEEKERANNLKVRMEELEMGVQFQHSRYKKYKQLYQEEKALRLAEQEKSTSELLNLRVEMEAIKTAKNTLEHENEALKEQLSEFVKSSNDENVMKTREIIIPKAGGAKAMERSSYSPWAITSGSAYPHENVEMIRDSKSTYPHENVDIIKDSSSESDNSGEFHLASTRFTSGLGLCPKNEPSEESDHVASAPIDIPSPSPSVIKRQPTRSPPMIEIISSGSDEVSPVEVPASRSPGKSTKKARNRKSKGKKRGTYA